MRARRAGWPAAAVAAVLVATVADVAGPTAASWTDRAHVEGAFGTGTWAVDGYAAARTVDTSVVVLADGATLDLVLTDVEATPADPGPNQESLLQASAGLPLVLTLSLGAGVAESVAAWSPTDTGATATVADVAVGLELLTIVNLPDLLAVGTSQGVITADAACPVPGAATASLPDLADLELEVLGLPVDVVLATQPGGQTIDVNLGLLRITVVIGLVETRTTTASSAEAALTAVLDVRVRTLVGIQLARVALTTTLAAAECQVTVP